MKKQAFWNSHLGILVALGLLFTFSCKTSTDQATVETRSATILKDYVHAPDSTFRYEIVHSVPGEQYDYHVLKMYSQSRYRPRYRGQNRMVALDLNGRTKEYPV